MKWIAPSLAYLAVGLGLFVFHSAWGALLGFHVAILGSLLIARPKIPVSVLFTSANSKWILVSVLLGASSGAGVFLFWNYFGIANNLPVQLEALGLNRATWLPFIVYFALVNPFVEEYFWRGYLGSVSRWIRWNDLLYAGFHALILYGRVHPLATVVAVAILTIAGWFWRQLKRKDGGLLASVLGHMAADLTILLAIWAKTV